MVSSGIFPVQLICVSKPPHRLDFISASTTKTTPWANFQDMHLQNLTARVLSAKALICRVRSHAVELRGREAELLSSAGKKRGEAFGRSATWWQQGCLVASAAGPALGPRRPPRGGRPGRGCPLGAAPPLLQGQRPPALKAVWRQVLARQGRTWRLVKT